MKFANTPLKIVYTFSLDTLTGRKFYRVTLTSGVSTSPKFMYT